MLGLVDSFSDSQLSLLWEQTVPILADLFLYSYENEFLDKQIKECKRKLARKFNLSYRYIDDLTSFSNKIFKEFIYDIYPNELTISEATESISIASYLDLLFTRDENNNMTTKLYDKRDAFRFHIVDFPFMSSNILSASDQPAGFVHLSSFAMSVVVEIIVTFHHSPGAPVTTLLSQGYEVNRL